MFIKMQNTFGARKFPFGTTLNLHEVEGSGTQSQSLDQLCPSLTVSFKAQLKRWLLPTHFLPLLTKHLSYFVVSD